MSKEQQHARRRTVANRSHQRPGRSVRMTLRYSPEEFALIREAAAAAGVTATSYTADAAVASARARPPTSEGARREAVLELWAARSQLRRYGSNLNQAARILNGGGEAPEWLLSAIVLTNRAVERIDATVTQLRREERPNS